MCMEDGNTVMVETYKITTSMSLNTAQSGIIVNASTTVW